MRTAKFELTQDLFFSLLGLNKLDGEVAQLEINKRGHSIIVYVRGDDKRIPKMANFPNSIVECKQIQGKIKVIK